MKKVFDDKLKEVVDQLPDYEAKPESWAAIEQYLDYADKLKVVKNNLPVYQAPDGIWEKLENIPKIKPKRSLTLFRQVAAVILILTGSWFIFQMLSSRKLHYSTEMATGLNPDFSKQDSSLVLVTEFIENQCRSNIYVCNEPDFSLKKQKLDEVNHEIEKLDEVIKTLGSSESLVKTRISLENYKAELIKDLIKKLTS